MTSFRLHGQSMARKLSPSSMSSLSLLAWHSVSLRSLIALTIGQFLHVSSSMFSTISIYRVSIIFSVIRSMKVKLARYTYIELGEVTESNRKRLFRIQVDIRGTVVDHLSLFLPHPLTLPIRSYSNFTCATLGLDLCAL